jgi:hypothetical protein
MSRSTERCCWLPSSCRKRLADIEARAVEAEMIKRYNERINLLVTEKVSDGLQLMR